MTRNTVPSAGGAGPSALASTKLGKKGPAQKPIKVAVLGGGVGSISAAFELTKPEYAGRYEVTVYQMGWRLGGKGASGRGVHGRIEEHGLHIWFGFYENAFRLMRQCYEELDRPKDCPVRTVHDAFHPAAYFGVAEHRLDRWVHWLNWFPDAEGEPGLMTAESRQPHSVVHYIVQMLKVAHSAFMGLMTLDGNHVHVKANSQTGSTGAQPSSPVTVVPGKASKGATPLIDATRRRVDQLAASAEIAEALGLAAAIQLASTFEAGLERLAPQGKTLVTLIDSFTDRFADRLAELATEDEAGRRVLEMVDLVGTIVRGLVADEIVSHPDGLDALDNFDLRDWLYLHGARKETVEGGLLRGIYDLVFAYRGGDPNRPAFAAGQALRGTSRMFFDYRGSFAYRMQGGMGDTVFAPFYEVLRDRGVRFEFFHRVSEVRPDAEGKRIEAIVVDRQVQLRTPQGKGKRPSTKAPLAAKEGDVQYDPLVTVKGLPCWPSHPKWELIDSAPVLSDGTRPDLESPWNQMPPVESLTLVAGEHFDQVVFGLSLGSVRRVCPEIVQRDHRWRAMVDNVATVATQALQIWVTETTESLGGESGGPVVAGYVDPFDTWADMSELIEKENWQPRHKVAGVHYFCSAMKQAGPVPPPGVSAFHSQQDDQVLHDARRFLDDHVGLFLPQAVEAYPSEFRWDLLVDDDKNATGHTRLKSQYLRSNVAESELYVQSLPGTTSYRLKPGDSGFENMVLAGDWTDTGFNAGCVEAATMSGLLAAKALLGDEFLDDIIGHADA